MVDDALKAERLIGVFTRKEELSEGESDTFENLHELGGALRGAADASRPRWLDAPFGSRRNARAHRRACSDQALPQGPPFGPQGK